MSCVQTTVRVTVGSAQVVPPYIVTPYQGITQYLSGASCNVTYYPTNVSSMRQLTRGAGCLVLSSKEACEARACVQAVSPCPCPCCSPQDSATAAAIAAQADLAVMVAATDSPAGVGEEGWGHQAKRGALGLSRLLCLAAAYCSRLTTDNLARVASLRIRVQTAPVSSCPPGRMLWPLR